MYWSIPQPCKSWKIGTSESKSKLSADIIQISSVTNPLLTAKALQFALNKQICFCEARENILLCLFHQVPSTKPCWRHEMERVPLKRTPDPGPNSKFRPHNWTKAQAYRTRRFIVKSVMSTSTQKSSWSRYSLQFACVFGCICHDHYLCSWQQT